MLLVLSGFRIVVLVLALRQGHTVDTDRFFAIAHAAGRPYVDYAVEYPPVLLAMAKLLGAVTPNEQAFTGLTGLISLLAEAGMAAMLWRFWSRGAALWFLAVDTLLLGMFVVRLDLVSVVLVVAAVAAALRSRPRLAAVCIVTAIGFKLWPAPIALVLLPAMPEATRRKYIITGAASLAVLMAAWVSLGGVAGITQVLTFRGAIGWQIESVVGSVVHVFTAEPVVAQAGAQRFGHIPAQLPMLMNIAALAVALWSVTRVRSRHEIGAAWVACVGAFLAASTLFSPQYTAWLIPAGAIAWASRDYAVAAAVAAFSVGTLLENGAYADVVSMSAYGTAMLLLRNLVLVIAVVVATRSMRLRAGVRAATGQPVAVA